MRLKCVNSMLVLTAVIVTIGFNEANAGFPAPPGLPGPPSVSINVNGFLPAPPGVHVMVDSGRPYYVERNRRVYMERERPGKHYKKVKKQKKEHHDNGKKNGHYK